MKNTQTLYLSGETAPQPGSNLSAGIKGVPGSTPSRNLARFGVRAIRHALLCVILCLAGASAWAQRATVSWTNSPGGDWNTAVNWDPNNVPGLATNTSIGSGNSVTYNSPMSAASINGVNLFGTLDISAGGFNIDGSNPDVPGTSYNTTAFTVNGGAILNVNPGGTLRATNTGTAGINGTLNVGGTVIFDNTGTNSTPPAAALLNGGIVNVTNGLFETTNAAPLWLQSSAVLNVVGGNVLLLPSTGSSLLCNGGTISITNGSLTANRAMTIWGATTRLGVGNGGTINVTNGALTLTTNATASLSAGGTIAASGTLSVGANSQLAYLTNNGGTITVGGLSVNAGNANVTALCLINGGTNDLGGVNVFRSALSSLTTIGAEGLIISNGLVRATNFIVGGLGANSWLTTALINGIVTNTGNFQVGQVTSARAARFIQLGGLMANTGTPLWLCQTNSGQIVIFGVNGGTNIVPGILIGGTNNTAGTINFTNAGTMVIGSGGITTNVPPATINFLLNDGGSFYSSADWACSVPMTLNSANYSIVAADFANTSHNITVSNRISGSGALTKGGGGTLFLNASNTYTASTLVNAGTLAIGAGGSISSSASIQVAAGANYDVTASAASLGIATNLISPQKLGGKGTVVGPINAANGTTLQPGGNLVPGTLTFSGSLAQMGGVLNNYDLSDDPTGVIKTNDFIEISGDLNLAGVNNIQVTPTVNPLSMPHNAVYPIIHYGGTLFGDVTVNFALFGASGVVSNNNSTKTISLVIQAFNRPATNTVWVGNAVSSTWDNVLADTNWISGASLVSFVTGDSVRFDSTGASHPVATVVGSVNPSNTVVDATTAYTLIGTGSVDGTGGLTKTNTGTLTIITTNGYPGRTIIGGGILEVTRLSASSAPSGIGASGPDPTNLVLFGTTLRFIGSNNATTDHGATLNDAGGIFDVANSNSLTLNGNMTGPGSLTKVGPGTLVLGGTASYPGVTTISNGTLQITPNTSAVGTNEIDFAGGTFNISSGLGSQPIIPNTFNVVTTGGLTVNGANAVLNGSWAGSGTLNVLVATNGIFTLNAAMPSTFGGTIALGSSTGPLRFNAGGNATSAQQCTGSTNVTFDLGTGTSWLVNRNGGGTAFGVYYLGALSGGPGTTLLGSTNSGSTSTYVIGDKGLDTTFAGTIENGFAGSTNSPQNSASVLIVKNGPGKLTLTGTNTSNGSITVTAGTLELSAGGLITRAPLIDVNAGATLDVFGRTDGTLSLGSAVVLSGEGLVRGSVTVRNGGSLSPGESPIANPAGSGTFGVMTITNNLVLQSGSTLVMDLDPSNGTNDSIKGLQSVTYGGTLDLSHYSTTPVTLSTTFKLFYANSYSGGFSAILPSAPGGIYGWDTSTLATDGTLRIGPAVPKVTTFLASGGNLTVSGINGAANLPFDVLTATNLTVPRSSWTLDQSGTFNGDGTFSFVVPITPSTTNQFYRLRYTFP